MGVLEMPAARMDTTKRIEPICEFPPGAGVLPLLQFEESIEVLRNSGGNLGMVWKDFWHGRVETLGDAEDAARLWRNDLVW